MKCGLGHPDRPHALLIGRWLRGVASNSSRRAFFSSASQAHPGSSGFAVLRSIKKRERWTFWCDFEPENPTRGLFGAISNPETRAVGLLVRFRTQKPTGWVWWCDFELGNPRVGFVGAISNWETRGLGLGVRFRTWQLSVRIWRARRGSCSLPRGVSDNKNGCFWPRRGCAPPRRFASLRVSPPIGVRLRRFAPSLTPASRFRAGAPAPARPSHRAQMESFAKSAWSARESGCGSEVRDAARGAQHNQVFASPTLTCGTTQNATERDHGDARTKERRPSANAAYSQLLLSPTNRLTQTRRAPCNPPDGSTSR
jgi:hypothetical protein